MSFSLRSYQREWLEAVAKDRANGFTRLLLDACGGLGKTTLFAALAKEEWEQRQGRTLVLANREQLVMQTVGRIQRETGLDVDIEMAHHSASPFAPIVVASVATIGRINRLTAFADNHFTLVVPDEAHHSLSNLFMRTMRYFHYGAESLADGWEVPKDGHYQPKACVLGTTATPDLNGRKTLGEFYQKFTARYSYLRAIEEGWLVGIKEVNIPVKIDTRKFHTRGGDFSVEDESNAIIPVIEELSEQIVAHGSDRKTMCFLPSLECARNMAEALNRRGLKAIYCSGECLDKDEKTEEFQRHGTGICLCLCSLFVEGTDFPSVSAIAWMRPTISKPFYLQGVMRMSRALPGLVSDAMTAEERRVAIASSAKPYGLLISPFFVSDRIDICSVVDLFVDRAELKEKIKKAPTDLTDAAKIRDFIKSLEEAADKHRHRQPRTIDPVRYSLSIGEDRIAEYTPETAADAQPATKDELNFLLAAGLDTSRITNSGQAQRLIATVRERARLGLASPKTIQQLTLNLGWPQQRVAMMSQKQAGVLVGRRVRYRGAA